MIRTLLIVILIMFRIQMFDKVFICVEDYFFGFC